MVADTLLAPISPSSPGGEDLSDEQRFIDLRQAIHPPPRDPPAIPDYDAAEQLAEDLLAKKSKDLRVAVFYTEALLQKKGFAGLCRGLELLCGLLEEYWEPLFPRDASSRRGQLATVGAAAFAYPLQLQPLNDKGHNYWQYRQASTMPSAEEAQGDEKKGERREAMLRDGKISPEAFADGVGETPKKFYKDLNADLDAALAAIQRLDTVTKQRFDKGDVPSYRELRLAVENVRVLAKELLGKKLIAEPDPVPAAGEAAKDGEHPVADGSSAGPIATVADAERRVIAAAEYLRKANPASPVSYLLLRGLRWGELRSHGGEAAEKLLAAPAPEARSRLRTHFVDERWDVLLDSAEQVMATPAGRGWLDLQFYAIRACEHLGEPRDDARRAILDALRSLLVDIPSLPNATLMDAMPTASPETKGWIDKDVLSKSGADDGAADDSRAARSPRDPFTVAQAEATSGHPERAIQLLARELAREGSERAQFLRRTQIATIMVENGLIAVAKPLLAQLIEQIEQSSVTLADWEEGSTLAQPFALMVKCLDAQPGDAAEKREDYYQRVCTLDPVQALRLTGR